MQAPAELADWILDLARPYLLSRQLHPLGPALFLGTLAAIIIVS